MTPQTPQQRRYEPDYALVYAAILPAIRKIGREHGYAIAVHGSMATDLDVVAVPWTADATDAESLVEAIRVHCMAVFDDLHQPTGVAMAVLKPHGRKAWSMHFDPHRRLPYGGPYLDISVMPCSLPATP